MTQVEVEVEVGVGDPVGVVEGEGHLDEAAAERLQLVELGRQTRPVDVERLEVGIVGPL